MIKLQLHSLKHMAQADIMGMVDPIVLAKIKETDSSPTIKVFSIAHPGAVKGFFSKFGNVKVHYFEDSIKKIYNLIDTGLECFLGHGKNNSHAGRDVVGRVIGKSLEKIDDIIHDVVAVHVLSEHKHRKLNVASMEVDVGFTQDDNGDAYIQNVHALTGIALGDGDKESPGFPGATLLAEMQAFQKGDETVTLAEVKAFIKENGTIPSDLFEKTMLAADKVVRAITEEQVGDETKARERVESNLNKVKDRHKEELGERDIKIAELGKASLGLQVNPLLEGLVTEMKLSDPQKAFIDSRKAGIDLTSVEGEDALKKAVKTHVDQELTEFKSYAKMFGAEDQTGDPDRGAGAGGTVQEGNGKDLTVPKNNPLIPQEASPKK